MLILIILICYYDMYVHTSLSCHTGVDHGNGAESRRPGFQLFRGTPQWTVLPVLPGVQDGDHGNSHSGGGGLCKSLAE